MNDQGRRAGWLLASPYLAGAALLIALPAVMNAAYAFTDHRGTGPANYIGLANFSRMVNDPLAGASLRASLVHALLSVPLRMVAATGLGLLLAAPRPGGRVYRAAVYLPTAVPDLALSLTFLWLLNPIYGPVNRMLGAVGLPQPQWLATPWGARLAVVLMLVFPIGEAFLVVLAARRSVANELYEAAMLDGATAWQQLRTITLPLLAPLLVLLAVRDTILTLQVNFVPAYILTDGGPSFATLYLPLYVFDQAFEFSGFGYGSALALLLLAVTAVLVALELLLARRWRILP